ncbi:MAG: hypothetical protein ACTS73_06775 [Arsenophonus sp. NEOnobi-MAG3]
MSTLASCFVRNDYFLQQTLYRLVLKMLIFNCLMSGVYRNSNGIYSTAHS